MPTLAIFHDLSIEYKWSVMTIGQNVIYTMWAKKKIKKYTILYQHQKYK